jgi:hypothetical protein
MRPRRAMAMGQSADVSLGSRSMRRTYSVTGTQGKLDFAVLNLPLN